MPSLSLEQGYPLTHGNPRLQDVKVLDDPLQRSNVFPIEMSELETRAGLHTSATLLSKTDVQSEFSYSLCEDRPLHGGEAERRRDSLGSS